MSAISRPISPAFFSRSLPRAVLPWYSKSSRMGSMCRVMKSSTVVANMRWFSSKSSGVNTSAGAVGRSRNSPPVG